MGQQLGLGERRRKAHGSQGIPAFDAISWRRQDGAMSTPDFNLSSPCTCCWTRQRGARRATLGLSASAMSRAGAPARATTGDPLLVRAGRGQLPPRALAAARAVPGSWCRRSKRCCARRAARAGAGRAHLHAAHQRRLRRELRPWPARAHRAAGPGVRLRFVQKPDKDSRAAARRHGRMETGVVSEESGPELRVQALFATASSAWCARGIRSAAARSPPRATPPASTSASRGAGATRAPSTTRCRPWAWRATSPSSAASPPRSRWRAHRSHRQRARAPHRQPARRPAQLRAAGGHARADRFHAVASAPARRPGAPVAARLRARGVHRAGGRAGATREEATGGRMGRAVARAARVAKAGRAASVSLMPRRLRGPRRAC